MTLHFRIMTYNIGGARKDKGSSPDGVIKVIKENNPDILLIQEAVRWMDFDGTWHDDVKDITLAIPYKYSFFGDTLSMNQNMDVRKLNFVQSIFDDKSEWVQGNAILSKYPFSRFSSLTSDGLPRNIPLYKPAIYEGSRDTDPRYAIIARLHLPPINPYVVVSHLTTLVGERPQINQSTEDLTGAAKFSIRSKKEEAELMRYAQINRIMDLVRENVLQKGQVIFIGGDFNATVEESAISNLLIKQNGFSQLIPENRNLSTHVKTAEPIDHLFFYPGNAEIDYQCHISSSQLAGIASDHRPVIADITISSKRNTLDGF